MSAYIRYQPIALGGGGGGEGVTTVGTIDSQPASLNGGSIVGTGLYFQSASASDPGLVNNSAQTFSGVKTFSSGLVGTLTGSASLNVLTSALGNLTDAGTDGITITNGTGAVVGNVSVSQAAASATQNGYLTSANFTAFNNKQPAGNYITALTGDGTASGPGSAALTLATVNSNVGTFASVTVNAKGLVIAASALNGDATTSGSALTLATVNSNVGSFNLSNITVNAKGLVTAASSTSTGNLSDTGTDGITITNGTNAVLGSGTTISQAAASATQNGYLSSANFTTFNNKQPAGNYVTALTGDVTASGPGSAAATLATVNSNVGSFTNASITVNAKGLITAASSGSPSGISSISVASANGLAGTSSGGTTPALTLSTTVNSPVLAGNGTAISAATTTGSGSTVVLSTSPTLVTPALGTPSSATLTNATGLPLTTGVTGVLPIANGGTDNGSLAVTAGGVIYTDGTKFQNVGAGTSGQILTSAGSGAPTWANNTPIVAGVQPTVQKFLSGSGTYTTPTGVQYIQVEMVGGGGGGSGSGVSVSSSNNGGAGGNTTFGTSLLVANGGGITNAGGGTSSGGTATVSSPAIALTAVTGGTGQGLTFFSSSASYYGGGAMGSPSPFGGQGTGNADQAGTSASANTGSGGGGAGSNGSFSSIYGGSGGSSGGYLKAIISSPSSTYAYSVGGGGSGGNAGTNGFAGGSGGSGIIIVTEYYTALAVGNTTTVSANQFLAGPTSGSGIPTFRSLQAPTIQVFNSGSGTYTLPSNPPLYIEVEMVGGGGGGSGSGTSGYTNGSAGTASTFGSSLLTANAGGGTSFPLGGTGGTAYINTPAVGVALNGGNGGGAGYSGSGTAYPNGGSGGSTVFGGSGVTSQPDGAGTSGTPNTGAGGGGGNQNQPNGYTGSGGGAGGYLKAIISSPSSTYAYTVGSGGSGGVAGSGGTAGGSGAAGIIIVKEYYQ